MDQIIKDISIKFIICLSPFLLTTCSTLNTEPVGINNHSYEIEIPKKEGAMMKCKLNHIITNSGERISFPYKNISPTLNLSYNGRYNGYAGCNSFFGLYTIEEENINFESARRTAKKCIGIEVEEMVIRCLYDVDNYTINSNGQLLLRRGDEILMVYDIYE